MKMEIAKVKEITLKLGLEMPMDYRFMLQKHPEIVDEIANGVGSETAWYYHLIPDTVWFLNINPASHIHDWEYTLPYKFGTTEEGIYHKKLADERFRRNCLRLINNGTFILKGVRTHRINKIYYPLLAEGGDKAYWANKDLPEDYHRYYGAESPEQVLSTMRRYYEIQQIINKEMKGIKA